ncbi:hypothetical protein HYV82_06560 [Candidatus Woesearchaeota archaeon]|nr:hypothetical protein [Candidatus Woesearchaeota archaeon]
MLIRATVTLASISVISVLVFNTITQFFGIYGMLQKGDFVLLNLILFLSIMLALYYAAMKTYLRIQIG